MKQKLLAILCVLFTVQMAAWAEETSGYCGDPDVNGGKDVKWVLSEDSVLTISGTGAMKNYSQFNVNSSPWFRKSSIKKVEIKEGVTSIGSSAFIHCYGLTNITLPSSVTIIGDEAFYYCYRLTSITIPNSVTSIGDEAFYRCSSLSTVTCLNPVPPTLNGLSFSRISENATLRVPDVDAYKASDWAKYFSTIEQIDLTAIRGIEAGKKNIPTTIHDLGGRRVTEPVKGRIYIVDGKTVVW